MPNFTTKIHCPPIRTLLLAICTLALSSQSLYGSIPFEYPMTPFLSNNSTSVVSTAVDSSLVDVSSQENEEKFFVYFNQKLFSFFCQDFEHQSNTQAIIRQVFSQCQDEAHLIPSEFKLASGEDNPAGAGVESIIVHQDLWSMFNKYKERKNVLYNWVNPFISYGDKKILFKPDYLTIYQNELNLLRILRDLDLHLTSARQKDFCIMIGTIDLVDIFYLYFRDKSSFYSDLANGKLNWGKIYVIREHEKQSHLTELYKTYHKNDLEEQRKAGPGHFILGIDHISSCVTLESFKDYPPLFHLKPFIWFEFPNCIGDQFLMKDGQPINKDTLLCNYINNLKSSKKAPILRVLPNKPIHRAVYQEVYKSNSGRRDSLSPYLLLISMLSIVAVLLPDKEGGIPPVAGPKDSILVNVHETAC